MRRVEIARALLHRPRLLLLDEPTVGLDIKARADILRHVRSLVREEGVSVLWATHLVDEDRADDDVCRAAPRARSRARAGADGGRRGTREGHWRGVHAADRRQAAGPARPA